MGLVAVALAFSRYRRDSCICRWLTVALLAIALAACQLIEVLPPGLDSVEDSAAGMRFVRPAAWRSWVPREHHPLTDGPLAFLASFPLDPNCATAPGEERLPPFENGQACNSPIDVLPPGGVLVTWYTSRILHDLNFDGELIDVAGTRTALRINDGGCGRLGATVAATVDMPSGSEVLSNWSITLCARDPGASDALVRFRELLASAEFER
jgi:hypothetical protein